ncbi:TRAP transporter small permease [Cytobacillus sp. NCCP-133]|uniref:TRAP transporter small permease n=1 Tax=Cytobacillus sp. NCCP-133 TaxID=766848 RepID=UPI0022305819|nr:TRAP transporter small permease [Cytobacillus sp. NCCP-133]GLB60292.1 hypothetical protein NCCP133_24240 [Cytobacillus sp. NCCP-133]
MLLKKIDYYIVKLLEIIITFCLSITVILTLAQVFYRFALKQSLSWSQEVVMISFVYSILFGAALAFEKSEHLTVDVWENAKVSIQKAFNVIAYIIVLVIIGVFFYYGMMLVSDNLKSGQIVGFLPIKKGYVYMALPISSLFMLYFHVKKVFKWPG